MHKLLVGGILAGLVALGYAFFRYEHRCPTPAELDALLSDVKSGRVSTTEAEVAARELDRRGCGAEATAVRQAIALRPHPSWWPSGWPWPAGATKPSNWPSDRPYPPTSETEYRAGLAAKRKIDCDAAIAKLPNEPRTMFVPGSSLTSSTTVSLPGLRDMVRDLLKSGDSEAIRKVAADLDAGYPIVAACLREIAASAPAKIISSSPMASSTLVGAHRETRRSPRWRRAYA